MYAISCYIGPRYNVTRLYRPTEYKVWCQFYYNKNESALYGIESNHLCPPFIANPKKLTKLYFKYHQFLAQIRHLSKPDDAVNSADNNKNLATSDHHAISIFRMRQNGPLFAEKNIIKCTFFQDNFVFWLTSHWSLFQGFQQTPGVYHCHQISLWWRERPKSQMHRSNPQMRNLICNNVE